MWNLVELKTPATKTLIPSPSPLLPLSAKFWHFKKLPRILMCRLHGEALIKKSIPCTFALVKHLNYRRGWGLQLLSTKENFKDCLFWNWRETSSDTFCWKKHFANHKSHGKLEGSDKVKGCLWLMRQRVKELFIKLLFIQWNNIAYGQKCTSTLLKGT